MACSTAKYSACAFNCSPATCKTPYFACHLPTLQGSSADLLRTELAKEKLEQERLTATVVKQRELIQVNTKVPA